MNKIKCPYCGEAMESCDEDDVLIVSKHKRNAVRVNDKGMAYSSVPWSNKTTYITGVPVRYRRCYGCGHLALFECAI